MSKDITFVDTTLRDGHQSLWAENMTTGMMLSVAEQMDRAGFEAMELISGSHLKKCVRELKEDPWERVRLVAARITETPLRVIAGRVNTFEFNPLCMYRLFMERMAANGIREARISEEWNDLAGWTRKVEVSREVGIKPIINMIYSVSPKHNDAYFAQKTREAASLDVPLICLKDPGGLLTPERMRTLVPVMYENCNGIPIELHTHCTTGLGPLCCLEALDLGIRSINTAVPPLADSSSNPDVFNVARNARALGYNPLVDESVLEPVSEHFMNVARREGFPIGKPVEYDYAQYQHQVPGGMRSNLQHQLDKVRLGDRFPQGAGRIHPGARRLRLSHHGDASVPVRGQPGGAQRHRGRPLQGGHRPSHPLRPGAGRRGRRPAHGPQRQGQDPRPAPGAGDRGAGTARDAPLGDARPAGRRRRVGRRAVAALAPERGRDRPDARGRAAPGLREHPAADGGVDGATGENVRPGARQGDPRRPLGDPQPGRVNADGMDRTRVIATQEEPPSPLIA